MKGEKMKKLFRILSVFVLFPGIIGVAGVSANITFLNPTDDSSIYNMTPGTNYDNDYLQIRDRTLASDHQIMRSLLKFDLSSISDTSIITSATLTLYAYPTSASGAYLYRMEQDGWSESTVAWSNYSYNPTGNQLGYQYTNTGNPIIEYTWTFDMNYWSDKDDLDDNYLTLILMTDEDGSVESHPGLYYDFDNTFFASMETPSGSTNVPKLEIQHSAVPIPGAIWLLGSGFIGIVGIRRKFIK